MPLPPSPPLPPAAPSPEPLAPHQRTALGALAAAGALGLTLRVAEAAVRARAAGLAPMALREALLLLVPYAGYPRALAAFKAAGDLGGAGRVEESEPAQRVARGRSAFERVYGPSAERVLEGLAALDPHLPGWTLEHAYGRVIARPGLALPERELLAVSLLTALGGLDDALLGHMRGAVRLGASVRDVQAAVEAVPAEVPEGHRRTARALLERLSSA